LSEKCGSFTGGVGAIVTVRATTREWVDPRVSREHGRRAVGAKRNHACDNPARQGEGAETWTRGYCNPTAGTAGVSHSSPCQDHRSENVPQSRPEESGWCHPIPVYGDTPVGLGGALVTVQIVGGNCDGRGVALDA